MPNDFSPFVPTWWAMGALAILNEQLVAMPLVNKDFSDMFASGGQIVNTRRPRKMTATRKHQTTSIAAQDAVADNVAIPLNQQVYNSFAVQDLDAQFSMADLMTTFLAPAGFAMAKFADGVVLGQAARWLYNGNIAGDNTQSVYKNIVDGRSTMDNQLAYSDNRHIIVAPNTEASMLKDNLLIQQYSAGSVQALRAGIVGNLVGVDLYKTQNMALTPLVTSATGVQVGTVAAAVNAGATAFTANQTTVAFAAGDWIQLRGQPFKIASVAGSSDPRTITLTRALPFAIGTSDTFIVIKPVTLNANYGLNWAEGIVLNPGANQYVPGVGNFIELGGKAYAIVSVPAANTLILDRPLEVAVTSGSDKLATIPPGNYSFMFHRDCMTVAIRPLQVTPPGEGVQSAVANYNGLSVRAQIWYNPVTQTRQVSLDFLMGVQVLDFNLGVVVCS